MGCPATRRVLNQSPTKAPQIATREPETDLLRYIPKCARRSSTLNAVSFSLSKAFTVIVGAESKQETFIVHENFICKRSEFFRSAMNGNWPEHEERFVKLPEDDPRIFALYLNLIYTNKIATNPTQGQSTCTEQRLEVETLSALYVLCEKLLDPDSKQSVLFAIQAVAMDKASDGKQSLPHQEAIKIMYEGTPEGSAGRRLFASMGSTVAIYDLRRSFSEAPREFLLDLAISLCTRVALHSTCPAKFPDTDLSKQPGKSPLCSHSGRTDSELEGTQTLHAAIW